MKILIVTDTFSPTINGVVTTLNNIASELRNKDHEILVIEPSMFFTIPSGYPGVNLAINVWKAKKQIEKFNPDSIHIATEGPLGSYIRRYCKVRKKKFTTSYHTNFPEYLSKMYKMPEFISYRYLRNFHECSEKIMVTTESIKKSLIDVGFSENKMVVWGRGVRSDIFNINDNFVDRNIALYIGRVSKEKNIEAFLDLSLDMEKWIIGDGPILSNLESKYKDVKFFGAISHGPELSNLISQASVKVFPSYTDTFGVVILEANACGVPVAGFPVKGPIDVVKNGINGYLDFDLRTAIDMAKKVDRRSCRDFAMQKTWNKCADSFFNNLVKV